MSSNSLQNQATNSCIVRDDNCVIIAAEPFADKIRCDWFDPDICGDSAEPVSSGGRGSAWFVRNGDERWVLRHYCRGGLVAKLSHDGYLYLGQSRVRSYSEFLLLKELHEEGLPVPRPIAAVYWPQSSFIYKAAILIEQVKDSTPFADMLPDADPALWSDIGKTIRRFHDYGVDHADLNCHNLLVGYQDISLIDFDRCRVRKSSPNKRWQLRNLSRLRRSVEKLSPEALPMWHYLLSGYRA